MMKTEKTLTELLDERDRQLNNGPWIPASGGTELPFTTRTGLRLRYMYQPTTGKHAYLNLDTDIFLTDDEAAREL